MRISDWSSDVCSSDLRVFPVANHAQALEVLALDVDLRAGVFAALLPVFDRIELHPDLAVLLLDRDLDRQAVAVPARDVGCVEAGQVLRLDEEVLEELVDLVADVVRSDPHRRPYVQHARVTGLCTSGEGSGGG